MQLLSLCRRNITEGEEGEGHKKRGKAFFNIDITARHGATRAAGMGERAKLS